MPLVTCRLAEDKAGKWQIAFDREALHVCIEFIHYGCAPVPKEWISVEDFLAWTPRNPLHRQALDCFTAFLAKAIFAQSLVS
ncbi:hypothetical protein [Mesorhizobium sp. ES1-6]|uniref:hypothetical protein n=1 Tax=Mesorhizobium sp. ES1-6 TaxID=2876626 RepID=UPI001CCCF483|nr:hypothetical protein [Mesorhizobium sp. ES1-6]MBZ9803402.1 hypothetical protein [Mesorhizobium sp. ES1-6]